MLKSRSRGQQSFSQGGQQHTIVSIAARPVTSEGATALAACSSFTATLLPGARKTCRRRSAQPSCMAATASSSPLSRLGGFFVPCSHAEGQARTAGGKPSRRSIVPASSSAAASPFDSSSDRARWMLEGQSAASTRDDSDGEESHFAAQWDRSNLAKGGDLSKLIRVSRIGFSISLSFKLSLVVLNLRQAIPFRRAAIWGSVAFVAFQLKDFFGLMMGTFIISFIGNSIVESAESATGATVLPPALRSALDGSLLLLSHQPSLTCETLPDLSFSLLFSPLRRKALVLLYFGLILGMLAVLGVVTVSCRRNGGRWCALGC